VKRRKRKNGRKNKTEEYHLRDEEAGGLIRSKKGREE
jgi:hypothetical protein